MRSKDRKNANIVKKIAKTGNFSKEREKKPVNFVKIPQKHTNFAQSARKIYEFHVEVAKNTRILSKDR